MKIKKLLLLLILFALILLAFNSNSLMPTPIVSNDRTDQPCLDKGGECMHGYPNPGVSCTVSDGRSGTIFGGLCLSRYTDMQYRCCVPEKKEEEKVMSDKGCAELGGVCEWTERGSTTCGDGTSCYISAACRAPDSLYSGNMEYRCCADVSWCNNEVEYDEWNDIFLNGNCPFSVKSLSEKRTWCSQGPYSDPFSHGSMNAVDIRYVDDVEYGSEYFLAPVDGYVTKSKHIDYKGTQKCGGTMVFEGNNGVIYEIRHAFIFAALRANYDENTGQVIGEPAFVSKGTPLAKIALESDDYIIDFKSGSGTCASGAHFHVKVSGTKKCADCHFVDDLGCDLRNPQPGECGRCWRGSALLQDCDCGDCKYCSKNCPTCPQSSMHYCCKTDCEICCPPPPPDVEVGSIE
jgi:hypothetical protein